MKLIEQEIKDLKQELLSMFLAVNNQLVKSGQAFLNFDKDIASEISNSEKRINALELKIDKDCENILALHSPISIDLRFVLSVFKINHELERIADIADGIAAYVNDLTTPFPENAINDVRITEMFGQCKAMMENVIEAFENEDTAVARKVFKQDELLNAINKEGSSNIIKNYNEKDAKALFFLLSSVRKLESVGDLTKNISEELIFSIESKVVKHKKNK